MPTFSFFLFVPLFLISQLDGPLPSLTSSQKFSTVASLPEYEKIWGLSPVKPFLRHRFEGVFQSNLEGRNGVDLRFWYEDSSVTKGSKPNSQIFCRIAHSLIFGRTRLRSKAQKLPIGTVFGSSKADYVRATFFAAIFRNRANAANTDSLPPSPTEPTPRVRWTREELITPYLSYTITRSEWETLSKILKSVRDQSFESFRDSLCEPVLRLAPNLRANFEGLAEANGINLETTPRQPPNTNNSMDQ